MTIELLEEICKSFPLVTSDIKWESNLCFSVAGKLFLIISLDEIPAAASFKVNTVEFENIVSKDFFIQAPHFAKKQWVKVTDISNLTQIEWFELIRNSYNLIKLKLSKKLQTEIDVMMSSENKTL